MKKSKKSFKFKVGDCVAYSNRYHPHSDRFLEDDERKWIVLNRTSERFDPITQRHYGSRHYLIGCGDETRNEDEYSLLLISGKNA